MVTSRAHATVMHRWSVRPVPQPIRWTRREEAWSPFLCATSPRRRSDLSHRALAPASMSQPAANTSADPDTRTPSGDNPVAASLPTAAAHHLLAAKPGPRGERWGAAGARAARDSEQARLNVAPQASSDATDDSCAARSLSMSLAKVKQTVWPRSVASWAMLRKNHGLADARWGR